MSTGNSLARLLAGRRGGVYRLAGVAEAERAERLAAERGLWAARVPLGRIRTKAGLLSALARALCFPAHFGANWDALADCLGDLSWLEAPGWLLILEGTEGLAAASPEALAAAVEVMAEAAAAWGREGKPFLALVQGGRGPRLPLAG